MPLVVSLKAEESQLVEPGGYRVVRFPYGGAESYDPYDMHPAVQPDGYQVVDWATDDRSGLIWPHADGWGELKAMIQWEAGAYTELRDQFVRDPLGLTDDPLDTTATEHRAPSPGLQCWTKVWGIFVDRKVPLALRAAHNDTVARRLVLAEYKLTIHPS